jgi:hypothetical protein
MNYNFERENGIYQKHAHNVKYQQFIQISYRWFQRYDTREKH